jgi:hypothetical protein
LQDHLGSYAPFLRRFMCFSWKIMMPVRLHPPELRRKTMTTSMTVPVTVTSQAAARIAALSLEAALHRMIEYIRQNLSELTRIEVVQYERDELGDKPGLAVDVYCPFESYDPSARIRGKLGEWLVSKFPAEVLEHLTIDYLPEAPNAG